MTVKFRGPKHEQRVFSPNTAHEDTLIIERTAKEYGKLKPMAPHFINNMKFKMSDSLKNR
ncbi:MAG: hypothetical protein CMM45_01575 [Rhodospirillaceae bacterium]|nr:hypothetical protein [Rhodospirillaceae bacterium]